MKMLAMASGILLLLTSSFQLVTAEEHDHVANDLNVQLRDKGDFHVVYTPTERFADLERTFRESKLFEEMASELNKTLALPMDIQITLSECGEANAYYDPESHQLVMCYELIEDAVERFSQFQPDEDALNKASLQVVSYVFLHELGHALVHVLELPITGKEEDAVDQLATYTLLEAGDEGAETAVNAATWFLTRIADTDIEAWPFWDEHSLDIQRFYNICCWVYGKHPDQHADLIAEGFLPQERAERCEGEFKQLAKSWDKLLAPHMKSGPTSAAAGTSKTRD